MQISRADLDWAVDQGHLTADQAEILWRAWQERGNGATDHGATTSLRFDFANVSFYFGALIVIVAMFFLGSLAWDIMGSWGIFTVAMVYGISLTLLGRWLYFQQQLTVPGGLLITIAVWMIPIAVYGLQRGLGMWEGGNPGLYRNFFLWVRGGSFPMIVATICGSLLALRFIHFPFLTFPLAFCLWFLSMDIAPLIYGDDVSFATRAVVTLWFGLLCLAIAYGVDLRCRRSQGDYGFWLYLSGLLSFWFSLIATSDGTEWHRFLFMLINLGLMALSIVLKRRLFMVFGALGVFGYICYLAFQVFADSLIFPFALSALGLAIIGAGILYQRHYRRLEIYFDSLLPPHWRNFLPKDR